MANRVSTFPNEPINGEVDRCNGLVQVQVELVGTSPMLMNAMSVEVLLGIRDKIKKPMTSYRQVS